MSTFTVATLPRISREALAALLKAKTPNLTVIDVRDSDYIGGHISGCQNVPTNTHDYKMPELVRTLKDQEILVFHCALSQQRGPASALRYLRERERLGGSSGSSVTGTESEPRKQKVYILDGGFTQWQEKYGEDKDLTEDYRKDLWQYD